jgi:hypothetical protein
MLSRHDWWIERRSALEAEEQRKREETERREQERFKKLEQQRIDGLLSQAIALRQARDIRSYVFDVRATLATPPPGGAGQFEEWASWALEQADRIDPVKSQAFLGLMKQPQGLAEPQRCSQAGD